MRIPFFGPDGVFGTLCCTEYNPHSRPMRFTKTITNALLEAIPSICP